MGRWSISGRIEAHTASSGTARSPWHRVQTGGYLELVANPLAIDESAPLLHRLGRTVAAPALNMRARRDFVRVVVVRLCGMNLAGVFVVGSRSVGADAHRAVGRGAAGTVGGRVARGICVLGSQEHTQSNDEAGHTLPPM